VALTGLAIPTAEASWPDQVRHAWVEPAAAPVADGTAGPGDELGPLEAQFGNGPVYVPPTAPPATDLNGESGRFAAVAGTYSCPGYSSIDDVNPARDVARDIYSWGGYPRYQVGNGAGNINWRVNPYRNPSWYMWLHSLRWLGQGITLGSQGDLPMLQHVAAIAHDWVIDNPYSWKSDIGAWESTMHRTNVLICLRQAVLSAYGVSTLPRAYTWINTALLVHAQFLTNNWSGAWNHGTDESIALFGVGCIFGRADYRDLAVHRLALAITTSIDSHGATNEQSTGYGLMNYSLWARAENVLRACNVDPGTTIAQRRQLLALWIAHATNSLGKLHQLGDSQVTNTYPVPGTPMEYAGTLGASGTPPKARVAIYSRGYVFGRTGWGTTGRKYTEESTYSIRFGEPRALHGHNDHTAITYTSRGRDILIDPGHAGYQPDAWRAWARSAAAHSSLRAPLATELAPRTTLNRYALTSTWEFFEFSDSPNAGVSRTRAVLVMKDPDLLVTLDRASSRSPQRFEVLWHLPSDQVATVYSRSTAVATAPGSRTKTVVLQIPYRQPLPAGALLLRRGETAPIQGWHFPVYTQHVKAPTLLMARAGSSAFVLSVVVPIRASAGVSYRVSRAGTSTVVTMNIGGVRTAFAITAGGSLVRL
jgi:hypothetical protein